MVKLCIAGKNNIAVDCLNYALTILSKDEICVVLNSDDPLKNTWQKSLGFYSRLYGVKICKIEEVYSISDLIFISIEYDKIIKTEKFSTKNLYNIHFSLLPQYKGVYTSLLPILKNEKITGVTLHQIDNGIDTGEIIFQKQILINKETTCRELYYMYMQVGRDIFASNFDNIIKGKFLKTPQSHNNSTYYGRDYIKKLTNEINPFSTAHQIRQHINAFNFREYQLATFKGVKINNCIILNSKSNNRAGTVIADEEDYFIINTIDYDIKLFKDYFDELIDCCVTNNIQSINNKIDYIKDINCSEKNGWTPLIIACYNGSLDIVNLLLEKGVDINKSNLNGTTPIMYAKDYALRSCDLTILEVLLSSGANIYIKDIFGKNIFDYLDNVIHFDIIELLNTYK